MGNSIKKIKTDFDSAPWKGVIWNLIWYFPVSMWLFPGFDCKDTYKWSIYIIMWAVFASLGTAITVIQHHKKTINDLIEYIENKENEEGNRK